MELRSMDLAEVRNLVKWIDEQQRKGKQELATLQQQFANQGREMSEMSKRLKELESTLSTAQTQITRLSQVDDQMAQLKAEIVHLIEQADDRRIQSEKEMERLRQVEQSANTRALTEIKGQLTPIPKLVEQMNHRQAEDERLSTAITLLQNQIPLIESRLDERVRDVAYLEELQRQDARRIAEIQQSLVDIQKQFDSLQTKDLIVEDLTRRNETKIEQLQQSELDRRQITDSFLEQAKLGDQKRKQELAAWAEKIDEFEELMAGYAKQWRLFEDQHRLSREATAGLQELKKRLELRQTEMSELQRVDTERMKQQWNEFLAEVDRLDKQQQLELSQWDKEQKRQRENYLEQFRLVEGELGNMAQDIKALFALQEKYADAFRQMTRIWLEGYESIVSTPITRKVPG